MKYKNPGCTADIIIERKGSILLVKRKHEPFKDMWALPGGYLEYGEETIEQTCIRETKEETDIDIQELKLFGVYSNPDRDPRGHVISHVYIATKYSGHKKAGDDAIEARYFPLYDNHPMLNFPQLAFDHNQIINDYRRKIRPRR